jgi:cytoskeletal protein CcmA (bactofilin family)
MQISGPFTSRDDTQVEELQIRGPAKISHHIIVDEDTTISGPCGISGTLECGGSFTIRGPLTVKEGTADAEEITVTGPLSVKGGTVRSQSQMCIVGPLTNNDGVIACDTLVIKGPLHVKNEGRVDAHEVNVSGPFNSDSPQTLGDVRIFGPLRCGGDFSGESIEIHGPVRVDGSLTATEQIDIHLGGGIPSRETLIDCDLIEAPGITISARSPNPVIAALAELVRALLPKPSEAARGGSPSIDVDLKGETIILRNVHHRGRIEGELILEDGATHEA